MSDEDINEKNNKAEDSAEPVTEAQEKTSLKTSPRKNTTAGIRIVLLMSDLPSASTFQIGISAKWSASTAA